MISYRFLSSLEWAGVSSLEVKYDILRYGDEEIWTWLSTLPRAGFDAEVCS